MTNSKVDVFSLLFISHGNNSLHPISFTQLSALHFVIFLTQFVLIETMLYRVTRLSCQVKSCRVSRRAVCSCYVTAKHFRERFSRSALWYPEAGLHYPVPGLAYHYLMGPERAVHNRERPFHDTETEAGFLQVRENDSRTDLRKSLLGECSG